MYDSIAIPDSAAAITDTAAIALPSDMDDPVIAGESQLEENNLSPVPENRGERDEMTTNEQPAVEETTVQQEPDVASEQEQLRGQEQSPGQEKLLSEKHTETDSHTIDPRLVGHWVYTEFSQSGNPNLPSVTKRIYLSVYSDGKAEYRTTINASDYLNAFSIDNMRPDGTGKFSSSGNIIYELLPNGQYSPSFEYTVQGTSLLLVRNNIKYLYKKLN